MAVNFPTSLDTFTNPSSTSSVANPSHSQQHADANDAIEALQAKVGTDNSSITTSHDYRIRQLELNPVTGTANKIEQTVVNNTGSTLLKGQVVYASGSVGASGKLRVSVSSNAAESTSSKTFGILAEDIINGGEGLLVSEGLLEGIDTSTASDGDPVWLGVNGAKIYGLANKPSAPAHLVFLGIVVRGGNVNNGSIFVKIQNGFELEELHNVSIATLADNQVLRYDATTGLWKNETIDNLFDPAGAAAAAQTAAQTYADTAASNAQSAAEDYADGLATNYDPAGAASAAQTAANLYTDTAITSLGNSISDPVTGYVPIGDVGSVDGVASLGPDGKVPASELDIDPTIQAVASAMITGGTHTNLSVTYDSVNKLLNFTAQGGGGANVSISSNAPSSPSSGDLWLDSDTAILYAYDGAYWVEISGSGGGGGGGGAGGFILSATAPTSPTEGDTWFDTVNGKLYVYYDSYWVEAIATGATGPTGPMFLDYQGAWNSGISYLENEGVTYIGSLWRLNAANSPAGTPPSTPNWQLVVQKGDKGDTGELAIGTVTTVTHGNPATVTNVGTSTDAILDFDIPAGPAATINVGTVDDVLYGNPPTVTNSGTTSAAVFDFEIPAGRAATITVGTVDDVLYGNPPTVTNSGDTSDAVFDFEIPAGRAATVAVGTVTTVVDGNPAVVTNSGNSSDAVFDFTIPAGPRSTITVGTVTDVDFGTPPTVTNVGTTSDAIFDFELTTGRASTLAVGTVTTGSYSSQVSVTNVGTTSDAIFNFSIPQGIPGDFQPGENPPANPLAGQVWYNTTTGRAYVYHDSFWVEFSPGFVGPAGPAGPAGAAGANGADGADGQSWTPVQVSSNITLAKDNRYFVDTSAARTLTLPASPALNDEIQILDASGTAATYNITVDRNANKINGGTGNLIIDMNGAWVTLLYTGSTYGWKVA